MAKVTITFTQAHVTRGEDGPDTVELEGTTADGKPIHLGAVEPRGAGEAFVRALGFAEFTVNEPVEFFSRSGRLHRTVAAHRVDATGKRFRKLRQNGKDMEVEMLDEHASQLAAKAP